MYYAEERDTGLRTITHANATAGTLYLRRVGNLVEFAARGVTVDSLTLAGLVPTGFRPVIPNTTAQSVPYWAVGESVSVRVIHDSGNLLIKPGTLPIVNLQLDMMWHTDEPWPVTLPGTPA